MGFLSETEKQRIADAIRDAEKNTSGELVTVIAQASDEYEYIPILWASFAALLLPWILLVVGYVWDVFILGALDVVYPVQIIAFIVLSLAFRWSPLKMWLIPSSVKSKRAARLCREQFFEQGLHLTRERTGVLVFVSVAERYVEIIADTGINDKVASDAWDIIVNEFVRDVKLEKIADGFVNAVNSCGKLLAVDFPRPDGDLDELPNHLIEI